MARAYVSIGSNIDREANIRGAVAGLRARFGALRLSPVYESVAVGFAGDHFYNLVAGFDTDLPPREVAAILRRIEGEHGRRRDGPRFSARTLDIDLLTWDDLVLNEAGLVLPRPEILTNAFVLRPLADIAPHRRHPGTGRTYAELWQDYPQASQPLWPIAAEFPADGGQPVSC